MSIRALVPADIPDCAELMAAEAIFQRYGTTVASAIARLEQALQEGAVLLVAERDGHAVGFVWLVPRGAFDRSGYVRTLAVGGGNRGAGVGSALLRAAEAALPGHTADMVLLCSDFNTAAHRFYRREGYEKVGELPDYVLPGVAEFIFRKRLR